MQPNCSTVQARLLEQHHMPLTCFCGASVAAWRGTLFPTCYDCCRWSKRHEIVLSVPQVVTAATDSTILGERFGNMSQAEEGSAVTTIDCEPLTCLRRSLQEIRSWDIITQYVSCHKEPLLGYYAAKAFTACPMQQTSTNLVFHFALCNSLGVVLTGAPVAGARRQDHSVFRQHLCSAELCCGAEEALHLWRHQPC